MTSALTLPEVAETLRNCSQPLVAFRLEDLTILGANEAAYELLGRPPGSLDGLRTPDVLSPDDRRNAEVAGKLLASGAIESTRSIRRLQRADSTEIRVNVYVQLVVRDGTDFVWPFLNGEGRRTAGRMLMPASRLPSP